jgi:hypothetical protein
VATGFAGVAEWACGSSRSETNKLSGRLVLGAIDRQTDRLTDCWRFLFKFFF